MSPGARPGLARHACPWLAAIPAIAVLGCAPPAHEAHWDRLRTGMSRPDVEALLGHPSSSVILRSHQPAAAGSPPGAPVGERWQYGDTLSSLATGAIFPDQADERAWCVFFGADGTVTGFRPPSWATKAKAVDPSPTRATGR